MPLGPRPAAVVTSEVLLYTPSDDAFLRAYPLIHEYLTTTRWEGGELRETSTLFLFFEQNVFKLMVNDRDLKRKCFVSAGSVSAVLAKADRGLETGDLDWRPDKTSGLAGRGSPKKG